VGRAAEQQQDDGRSQGPNQRAHVGSSLRLRRE
jgi:hypothetical protein